MIEEPFDERRLFETGALFSDAFEDRSRYLYHGSSTLNAAQIESVGFAHPFSLVSQSALLELADELPAAQHELANSIRTYGSKPTRSSFSAYSYWAVGYASSGQILDHCRRATQHVKKVPDEIAEKLEAAKQSLGCVYAIDMHGFDAIDFVFEGYAFYCTSPVPPERLAARVIIPSGIDIKRLESLRIIRPGAEAWRETGSLASIKRLSIQSDYSSDFE